MQAVTRASAGQSLLLLLLLLLLLIHCLVAPRLDAQGARKTPPLPAKPVVLHTFEPETYEPKHTVGEAGSRSLLGPGDDGFRTALWGGRFDKGIAGQGLVFGSTDDAVEMLSIPELDVSRHVTVSVWARVDEVRESNYVVSKEDWGGGTLRGFVLRLTSDGLVDLTIGNAGWLTCLGPKLTPATWYHLAATCDAEKLTLWVDGKLVQEAPSNGGIVPSAQALAIGRGNFDKSRGFAGAIDEVAIYDRALGKPEIEALHVRGKAGVTLAVGRSGSKAAGGRAGSAKGSTGTKGSVPAVICNEEAEAARLHVLAKDRLALLLAHRDGEKKGLSVRVGAGFEFAPPIDLGLPGGAAEEFESFESRADARGELHIFLRQPSKGGDGSVLHYLRLDGGGAAAIPWTPLSAALGLESQLHYPFLVSQRGGKCFLHATGGVGGAGALVTAEVLADRIRVLRKTPLASRPQDAIVLEGSWGLPVAVASNQVWLVDPGPRGATWTSPLTGKSSAWFSLAGPGEIEAGSETFQVEASGGIVYAVAHVFDADARGAVATRLLLARGKPGAAAVPVVLDGRHDGEQAPRFLIAPNGRVHLLATARLEGKEDADHALELWDVSQAKPARAMTALEDRMIWGATAAFGDGGTLHAAWWNGESWVGVTLALRK